MSLATRIAQEFNTIRSLFGANDGLATLDSGGKVPSTQLPSYVDDVLEVATYADLPATGEASKIYIVVADETQEDTTSTYRWTGTVYALVSQNLTAGDVLALLNSATGNVIFDGVQTDTIVDKDGTGAPDFPSGLSEQSVRLIADTLGDGATLSTTTLTITQKFTTLPSTVWDGTANVDIETITVPSTWPDGTQFEIVVPRTAPETGGTAGALGNYVRFVHGTGNIQCDANRKEGGAYSYRAYPDANDRGTTVSSAALFEKLKFVKDAASIKLIALPEDVPVSVPGQGESTRKATGWKSSNLTYTHQLSEVSGANDYVWNFTDEFVDNTYAVSFIFHGATSDTTPGDARQKLIPMYLLETSASVTLRLYVIDGTSLSGTGSSKCKAQAVGRWKPQD